MSSRTRWALLISIGVHVCVLSMPLSIFEKDGRKTTAFVSVELIRESSFPQAVGEGPGLEDYREAPAENTGGQDVAPPAPQTSNETVVEKNFEPGSSLNNNDLKEAVPADKDTDDINGQEVSADQPEYGSEPEDKADLKPSVEESPGAGPDVRENTGVRLADEPSSDYGRASETLDRSDAVKIDQIRDRIRSTQYYPLMARKRGWEGRTTVRFRINGDGGLDSLELVESSGINLLDQASVKAVEKGAPYPAVEGWIKVPIVFRLTM